MAQFSEKGVHWLSRLKHDTHVYDELGHKQDLLKILPQSEETKSWQIELIFKLWKQHMQIDHSVSQNPYRVLCELYIKLMAALVQHWIVLASPCWQLPNKSLVKANKVIAAHALCIAGA